MRRKIEAAALAWFRRSILIRQRDCYRTIFDRTGSHAIEAERVLADLRDFCRAEASTFDLDPYLAAHRAGKREVWLRIQYFLNLTDEEVHRLVEVKSDYVEDERDDD